VSVHHHMKEYSYFNMSQLLNSVFTEMKSVNWDVCNQWTEITFHSLVTTLYDIVSAVNHKEKRHDVNKTICQKIYYLRVSYSKMNM
jgi:hypothetical protein